MNCGFKQKLRNLFQAMEQQQQQQATIPPSEIPQDSFFYDHLKCAICLETAIEASESSCCHNIYCESCLTVAKTQKNQCPSCRYNGFDVIPSLFVRRLISIIPISCPFKCSAKITVGDLEAHKKTCPLRLYKCYEVGCEEFQGDHKGYTEHIVSKHFDKIVPAMELMRMKELFTKSGKITGFYVQGGQHPIEGTFRMEDGQVFINTHDEVGSAGWKGEVDKKELTIKLIKTYHRAHSIVYKGKFDKDMTKLTGRWSFRDYAYNDGGEAFELNFIVEK